MIEPTFVFDSKEKWLPVDPCEAIKRTSACVPDSFKWASYARRRPADQPEAIDFLKTMKPEMLKALPPVGYRRVLHAAGFYWIQFWLFYAFNPWAIGGVGSHEGDWEFVQFGCVDEHGERPAYVTASQHHTGGKREPWAVARGTDVRPLIYVARGSHANYFAPGIQGGGVDRCDGRGRVLDAVKWREFGDWATWKGRWGNSDTSPLSPGRQGHRWTAPHLWHSAAR